MVGRHTNSRRGPRGTGHPDPGKDRTSHEAARGKSQASSSLRDLSDEEFDATIGEIEAGSDRVSGILAAAVLQSILIAGIATRLKDTSEIAKLFDDRGPLSTFSSQIMIGRALGLYNARVEQMLHIIRKIRNKFAHSVLAMDFSDAQIVGWCNQLTPFENKHSERVGKVRDARRYYEDACFHMAGTILWVMNADLDHTVRTLKRMISAQREPINERREKSSLASLLQIVTTSLD